MNAHYFEHPLNEKTRIYLRVEALLTQLDTAAHFDDDMKYLIFYRSLFDLVEIFEQIQLKSELAKERNNKTHPKSHFLVQYLFC